MFDALPPELVLRIFALLDIQQLQACQLVSPSWNIFIKLNDSVLYRALAVQHNFISNVCTLDEAENGKSWTMDVFGVELEGFLSVFTPYLIPHILPIMCAHRSEILYAGSQLARSRGTISRAAL